MSLHQKNLVSLSTRHTLFFRQECQYIKCPSHVSYVHTISNVRALNRFLKTMRIVKTNNNKESEEKGKNDHKNRFFLVLLLSYFFVSYLLLNILLFVIWTSSSSPSYTRRLLLRFVLHILQLPLNNSDFCCAVCSSGIYVQWAHSSTGFTSLLLPLSLSHTFLFLLLVHNHHHHHCPPPPHSLI